MRKRAILRESGQTIVETSLGLLLICVVAGLTINLSYFIGYAQTIHASAYEGALTAAGSIATGEPTVQAIANATSVAQSVAADNANNPTAAVTACVPEVGAGQSGCAGFADPEAGSNGAETGQFAAASVTTEQSFTAFMKGSLLGKNLIPFLPSGPVSTIFYTRLGPPITPILAGASTP